MHKTINPSILPAQSPPKDGKLYAIKGYTGIKIRFLKQSTVSNDYSYYIYYRVGGRRGKQILQKIGTKSQGMTAKKASKIRLQRILEYEKNKQPGLIDVKNVMPVKNAPSLAEIWQEYTEQKGLISSYASIKHCYRYLKPFYAKTPHELSTKEINLFRRELENKTTKQGKKLAPQTVAHILKLFRTLVNFAVKSGLCIKNDTLHFNIPKVQNTVQEFLTEKQLKQYVDALQTEENPHAKTFLMIALFTGMRKKAIYNLAWQDIDFCRNTIYLQAQNAKKRQADFIPLPLPVKKLLKILPKQSEYLFLNSSKKPYANYFQKAKAIKEKIGLPEKYRPFYMLRHNFASLLANSGTNLYTIQKLLTHNSPVTTQRYAHLNDKSLRQSSKCVSKIIQKYFTEEKKVL